MTHSECHEKLTNGVGKCSVPMWCDGVPAGFCDEPAYGMRPPGKTITRWDGYEYREDGRYAGYVPALACPRHGGPKHPDICPEGCQGIEIEPGVFSGCSCRDGTLANGQQTPPGFRCDCPNHPGVTP